MALGALIGAYQEDESGALRALLPLAGQTLIEYQARCLAAVGAAPLLVLVERVPVALNDAFERLRAEGIAIIAVSDGVEAASRFEAGNDVLLLADGIAPDMSDLARLADDEEPAILTVPDDDGHAGYERIDASYRWAGCARIPAGLIGATAAMIGDWDLQSTLLRRAVQSGIALAPAAVGEGSGPFLADGDAMTAFERRLLLASRGARRDWVSRYLLPIVEEIATERLMETRIRPEWLVRLALVLTIGAAFAITRGWLWPALAMLLVSTPLDLVARRLGMLRLRPLSPGLPSMRLLWPAAGLTLVALGWFVARHGGGWGALVAAVSAAAFAEAMRIERSVIEPPQSHWYFSRRAAIVLAVPFAIGGWWNAFLVVMALYAAISFFLAQHIHHRVNRN
ncbi:MAG: hypothetical protein LH465_08495 [Sphingomonas bacterium]|nr:hypothetical protein [Sphingomonas bacterium]